MNIDRDQDTICAVATPFGRGGISVIRVSGSGALASVKALCAFIPDGIESHRVYYGILKDAVSDHDIDEVMVTYFKVGRSFTGEESVEISCHGNPVICERILQSLVRKGARVADRGEFTYRAFMNGRIDLVQAESVLALIESQTKESSRVALQQLKGHLSTELESLESHLTWALAHIEASIDFSTEGIDVVDENQLVDSLELVQRGVFGLLKSYDQGRLLKEGVRVALVGRPNVGKSSLLNSLVEEERAIVTAIPGTTRDIVEAETTYNHFKFSFLDTAGLRDNTEDIVEKMGIEKTKSVVGSADIVLFVIEAPTVVSAEELAILSRLEEDRTLIVVNKSDLGSAGDFEHLVGRKVFVSALSKTCRETLLSSIAKMIGEKETERPVLLIQSRHFESLNRVNELLNSSLLNLRGGASPEFVALDLKQALIFLQEILGKRFDDQIMDRVFKEFCIGK